MNISRLEIYLVNLDGSIGREERKTRPALIVSSNAGNQYSDIVTIMPITSSNNCLPTHVRIPKDDSNGLSHDSMAIAEQMRTIDKKRIIRYIGKINSPDIANDIKRAINVALS